MADAETTRMPSVRRKRVAEDSETVQRPRRLRAWQLQQGQRFRVVGLLEVWECVSVKGSWVNVRDAREYKRSINTREGDVITFYFKRPPFFISRETNVEVGNW